MYCLCMFPSLSFTLHEAASNNMKVVLMFLASLLCSIIETSPMIQVQTLPNMLL